MKKSLRFWLGFPVIINFFLWSGSGAATVFGESMVESRVVTERSEEMNSKTKQEDKNLKDSVPTERVANSSVGISFSESRSSVSGGDEIVKQGLVVTKGKKDVVFVDSLQVADSEGKVKKMQVTCNVAYDPRFGQALLCIPVNYLSEVGFKFGDSLDIEFSNGFKLTRIPLYSGYSTKTGEPLLVIYPGSKFPAICRNNGNSIYKEAGLKEGDKVTITLNKKGEFLHIENAMKLVYSNDPKDYSSIESFTNIRAVSGGVMAKGVLYRGTSPVDNIYGRRDFVNDFLKKNNISYIINLSNKSSDLESLDENNNIAVKMYKEGRCICLGMTCNYRSRLFAEKVVEALRSYLNWCKKFNNGKPASCYIHCLEGKDRTGFVCALLEMLCKANKKQVEVDYMLTYKNFYGVTEENDKVKYDAIIVIKFNDFFDYLLKEYADCDDSNSASVEDIAKAAAGYLKFGGMVDDEIEELKELISER